MYRAFVDNYKVAVETADKCCQANAQFAEISEVCNHATAGLQQASVWCCAAPRDKWWQGCFRQSSQCNELSDCSSCFNCSVGQLLWFLKFFLSYSKYFLWCWLPGRISWSEAQRIAKTSRLNIHWKVSSDSDEHSASTLINIARSSWVVMRPVELTLPPPQLSSTSLWTEWRAVLLFCM